MLNNLNIAWGCAFLLWCQVIFIWFTLFCSFLSLTYWNDGKHLCIIMFPDQWLQTFSRGTLLNMSSIPVVNNYWVPLHAVARKQIYLFQFYWGTLVNYDLIFLVSNSCLKPLRLYFVVKKLSEGDGTSTQSSTQQWLPSGSSPSPWIVSLLILIYLFFKNISFY